jgi:HK97 family phage major capsid protein
MKFENSNDAKQKKHTIFEQMEALLQKRKNEKRGFTTDEATQYDNLKVEFDHLNRQILELERSEFEAIRNLGGKPMDDDAANALRGGLFRGDKARGDAEFYDRRTEKPVPVIRSGDRFTDHFPNDEKMSFGKAVRGLVTGDWRGAENERQLSTGSNSGLLVPMSVMSTVWDMARARSIAALAGAQFVPMDDGRMSLVRVSDVSGLQVKTENEAFSGGGVTFDPVLLKAHTIGTVILMSRELAEDGLNVARAIEQTLAAGVADFLDKMIFIGSGDGEPLGLLNDEDINQVQADGAVSYAHLLRAWSLAKANNAVNPNIVSSADLRAQFANLFVDGSGFLSPPSVINQLPWHGTSNILIPGEEDAENETEGMIIGDFTKLLIGIRQNALVEISNHAGDTFNKHQIAVKVTMRADFTPVYSKMFSRITGIVPGENWWTESSYPVVGGDADDAADDS